MWSSVGSGAAAAVFNHGFECHVFRRKFTEDVLDTGSMLPARVLMSVYRKDSWDRHNFLGYSFLDIPTNPGMYDVSCRLWAPVGTIHDTLKARFCGVSPGLMSVRNMASVEGGEENPTNRSFLKTRTVDGNVRVLLNIVEQRTKPARKVGEARGSRVPRFQKARRRLGAGGASAVTLTADQGLRQRSVA